MNIVPQAQTKKAELLFRLWSLPPDLNRRPTHYECVALPAELRGQFRCRGDWTRTSDPYVPNVVRYQLRHTSIVLGRANIIMKVE